MSELESNLEIWKFGKELPTKSLIESRAQMITQLEDPLTTYLEVKFIESVIKKIIEDKDFRKKVKEGYLKASGGTLDKIELFGIEVAPVDKTKANMLEKQYVFSEQVDKMEKEVEEMKSEISLKETAIKLLKTIEINNGTAKEITIDNILGEESKTELDSDITKNFNLKITFK